MALEPSPAFQFYVKDWRSSRNVMRMTFAERGMYLEMLLEQWENLDLPDSPEAVADIIGGPVTEWIAAWPQLRRKFVATANNRIQNEKLEEVRDELRRYKKTARKGGVERAKSAKRRHDGTYLPATQPAVIQQAIQPVSSRVAPAISSTATATATATAISTATAVDAADLPTYGIELPTKSPTRGIERGRIYLHRWQVDDLIRMLGPHAATFDLDTFVFGLSARADAQGLALKKGDVWGWVQAQLDVEIQLRGIPVARAGPSVDESLALARAEIDRQNEAVRRHA